MYVASKLGHLLWFPIGGPSHTSSCWLSDGLCSVSTVRQFSASLVKARRNVCLNASCVCLFEDASVGYPILPVDTENSSEYALLELFEHFNMATVADPCITTV